MQFTLFDGSTEFKIDKPIRLIELFGGYGSQHFALEYLGANVEQWKLCEWAVKSIQAYKDAHFKNDNTDYSKDLTKEELIDFLANKGISANYNEPMSYDQVKRLSEDKIRTIYNNIKATHNLVNIQQVKGEDLEVKDTDKYCYVMTYSFPCQDLSSAGLGKGMEKGSGTRSGMLWEVERILDEINRGGRPLPQVLLMENVPEVIGENNIKSFASWLAKLESLGYHCYWKVLNAKEFGIPQNRERCFMVSILGDYYYDFPNTIKLEHKLKDLLEDEVDESFYLSDSGIKYVLNRTPIGNKPTRANNIIGNDAQRNAGTITTSTTYRGEDNYIVDNMTQDEVDRNIYLKDNDKYLGTYQYAKSDAFMGGRDRFQPNKEIADTLQTPQKEGIVENLKTKLCNDLIANGRVQEFDVIRHSYSTNRMENWKDRNVEQNNISPTLDTRCDCLGVVVDDKSVGCAIRGRYDNDGIIKQQVEMLDEEVSNALTATFGNKINLVAQQNSITNYRIRKLTPRECFRLMGVKDQDYEKIAENQSNASLYHLAGDSIVVNVLMAIFKQML